MGKTTSEFLIFWLGDKYPNIRIVEEVSSPNRKIKNLGVVLPPRKVCILNTRYVFRDEISQYKVCIPRCIGSPYVQPSPSRSGLEDARGNPGVGKRQRHRERRNI